MLSTGGVALADRAAVFRADALVLVLGMTHPLRIHAEDRSMRICRKPSPCLSAAWIAGSLGHEDGAARLLPAMTPKEHSAAPCNRYGDGA